jgi:hypothetical protein
MSNRTPSSSESLARRLGDLAARRAAGGEERLRQLQARRAEQMAAAASGPPPDCAALAASAAALEVQLAERQAELASLAAAQRALVERERELAAAQERSFGELCARCAAALGRLPLLAAAGRQGWLTWLEDWHRRSSRPFEARLDWRGHYGERNTVDDAMCLVEPAVELVRLLEVGSGGEDDAGNAEAGHPPCAVLPAEIEREGDALRRLEEVIASRIAKVRSVYQRIVADLPDPCAAGSLHQAQRLEGLLVSLEATLGRFAASARIERQMLEAL